MKPKYTSVPSNENVFRYGAIAIGIGFLFSFIANAKNMAVSYWDSYSVYSIGTFLSYVLGILGAYMLYRNEKYGLKMPLLFLILGMLLCDVSKAAALVLILVLISTFAFKLNVKYKYCKFVKMSWVNLIAAILSALMFVASAVAFPKIKNYETILLYIGVILTFAGLFVISFFTKPVEGKNLVPYEIGKANLANRNILHIIGTAFLAADFIFLVIANKDIFINALNGGLINIFGLITALIPFVLYFAAIYMLFYKVHTRRGWIVAILLLIVFQYTTSLDYIDYVMPNIVFFFVFILTFGFKGNDEFIEERKLGFTIVKIVSLVSLALCLVVQIKGMIDFADYFITLIKPLSELKTKAGYPFNESYSEFVTEQVKTILLYIPGLLRILGLTLIILPTVIIKEESVAIRLAAKAMDRIRNFIKSFCEDVAGKIKKLAKLIATILLVIAAIELIVLVLAVILYVLLKLDGDPIVASIGMKQMIICVLIVAGSIIGLLVAAIPFWFVYAYGQITGDVKEIKEGTGSQLEIDYGDDESLPEL